MTFGITPAGGFPPAAAEDFPNFIQFQADGTDLGGPDADTLNIVGATVSRGTGENANVVTVEVTGGEGGSLAYTSEVAGGGDNDGELYVINCGFIQLSSGTGVNYNGGTGVFVLDGGYVYEFVTSFPFELSAPVSGYAEFGVEIDGKRSVHSRDLPSETSFQNPRITDTFLVPVAPGDPVEVQVEAYVSGNGSMTFSTQGGQILVRPVGSYNPS